MSALPSGVVVFDVVAIYHDDGHSAEGALFLNDVIRGFKPFFFNLTMFTFFIYFATDAESSERREALVAEIDRLRATDDRFSPVGIGGRRGEVIYFEGQAPLGLVRTAAARDACADVRSRLKTR